MAQKKRNASGGRDCYDFTVDLHGMYADDAMTLLRKVVSSHPRSSILVIHGHGTGTLRSRIRGALASGQLPCREFFNGEDIAAPGLDGVTVVHT